MEPVIEAKRGAVDPNMIEMKRETEVSRSPIGIIVVQVFEIRQGDPEIRSGQCDDQCIVNRVHGVVGILELVASEGRVHENKCLKEGAGEQKGDEHLISDRWTVCLTRKNSRLE